MKMKSFNNTDSEYPVHISACHIEGNIGGENFGEFIITKACLVKCVKLFNSKLWNYMRLNWTMIVTQACACNRLNAVSY